MKSWLSILFLLMLPCRGFAQKAYELARYAGKLQGKVVKLDVGNGYIGASQIRFYVTDGKPLVFLPESGVPNHPFILRNTINASKDYFALDKMQEAFEVLPAIITGKYLFDKRVVAVQFYLVK